MTEEQKQQLMTTTLTNGTNAWEFVQSRPQDAQPWVAKGILSCIDKGYRLDLLMIGWETRDIRRSAKSNNRRGFCWCRSAFWIEYEKLTIKSNCLQVALSPTVKSSISGVFRFLIKSNFADTILADAGEDKG